MTIGVEFFNRDFSDYTERHWDSVQVNKYSKHVVGGSLRAEFDVFGSEDDIWKFVEMIRCPVKLVDHERGQSVWWGLVSKVEVYSIAGVRYGADIEGMANRIALAYTYNGERETTLWVSDAESVAEYGQKDILFSSNDKSEAQAYRFCANKLDAIKYPVRLPLAFGKKQTQAMARIECIGWIATLAWTYYENDEGRITNDYLDSLNAALKFGYQSGDYGIAVGQSFKNRSSTNWQATSIGFRMRKHGDPLDGINLSLRASSGENHFPGSLLETCQTLPASAMSSGYVWYDVELDNPITLELNTEYWIHGIRSEDILVAPEGENQYYFRHNCYNVSRTDDLYSDGREARGGGDYSESKWDFYSRGGHRRDLNFRVLGESETTVQIARIVSEAEFFNGSDILQTTGVSSCPFRNGDATSLYEIEELLKIGTASGARLLATVTEDRILRVYEEPLAGSEDHFIDRNNIMTDQYDNEVNLADCPVAYWLLLKDIIPMSVDLSRLISAGRMFVEQSEYDVKNKTYKIVRTRDSDASTDALAKLKNPRTPFGVRERYRQG